MSSIKIQLTGLANVQKALKEFTKEVEKKVITELNTFGEDVVRDAKQLAPTNDGKLKSSITYIPATPGKLEVEIVVRASYAAYVEFGTRKFAERYVATLPPDWQTFAAQFKNTGEGTIEDMIRNIMQWVKNKQIGYTYNVQTHRRDRVGKQTAAVTDEATAYAIAIRILQNGIHAHPFLYPAVTKNTPPLRERLKALLH